MKIGTLDQRIRIDVKNVTTDPDYGTETVDWEEFATVWANVQDVLPSRAESQAQGIRIANRPARIRMRWIEGITSDITSDMRVVLLDRDNRELQIVAGPSELGRREGIELMAEEFSTTGETA